MKILLRTAAAAIVLGVAATSAQADDMKKVAISTIVEVPALTDTKQGIVEALAARGFVDGETITIDYQNANGNMPTQQQIAKKFVGDNPDIIMPITTPTSQAMVSATSRTDRQPLASQGENLVEGSQPSISLRVFL